MERLWRGYPPSVRLEGLWKTVTEAYSHDAYTICNHRHLHFFMLAIYCIVHLRVAFPVFWGNISSAKIALKMPEIHCLMPHAFSWGSGSPSNSWFLGRVRASPQSRRHHDRFSRFRKGDCRVSLYFTMGCPLPQNCPFPWDIWTPHGSLGQPKCSTQTGSRLSRFAWLTSVTDRSTDRPIDRQTDRQTTLLRL